MRNLKSETNITVISRFLSSRLIDRDGTSIQTFEGTKAVVKPGETITLKAVSEVDNLHFWSWGYGYLYTVKTSLWVDGRKVDEVATRTGFRKNALR